MDKFSKKIWKIWAYFKIPSGVYCYKITNWKEIFYAYKKPTKYYVCPFWEKREDWPEQANGYCHYLGWGDMDKNNNSNIIITIRTIATGEEKKIPASESEVNISLLWDQCKECGIKNLNWKEWLTELKYKWR